MCRIITFLHSNELALITPNPVSLDLDLAETIACREVLSWLKNFHHDNIILDSDCQFLNQSLARDIKKFSFKSLIVHHCKHLINSF